MQSSSNDREDDSNEESPSREDLEGDFSAVHTDTLRKYTVNYPEQAAVFEEMFENMQVLRNTINNSSTTNDWYSDQVLVVFRYIAEICRLRYDTQTSTGTVDSQKMRVLDFAVEIEAAELLQRFAQNYFKDFYEMGGEQENDNSSLEDKSWENCFSCLRRLLETIQNCTDFHDGFCSASARAGVVAMCLENALRLDRENDNWQSGDDESEPLQLIDVCIGILHNISRRLREPKLFVDSEETLLYFAKVKKAGVAVTALLCLAYLVNEETNHLISASR